MPNSSASKPPWRSQVPPEAPAGEQASHSAIRQARAETATRARVPDKESDIAPPAVPQPTDEPAVEGPTSASDLPSFLQEPAGRWRRRGGRRMQPRARKRTAMIGALLLLGLLVLQVLRHERDVLAARQPGLRPLLTQLCAVTGCTVATLRRIGSITVDGATFARERIGDGFRLNFTLRNDAATALAMPAIELSLLDTQQRAVVRRVIGPAEFGAPPELGARAERAAALALAISGTGAAALPPVAGYRVIAFYP